MRAVLLPFSWLLFFSGELPAGPGDDLRWQTPLAVAAGEAFQGRWRMNDSDFRFVDDAAVAVNDRGKAGMVWADQARQDIHFQLYDAEGSARFDEAVNISASPEIFSWLPRVLISDDDAREVHVLWQEIVFSGGSHGGEIFFARSTDGGASFSEPLNLSRTTAGAGKGRLSRNVWDNGSLDLARGPDNHLYAAWTEYEGALRLAHSTDGGESFSEARHIAGSDEQPARAPSLAVHNDRVCLGWTHGEDPQADIHLACSDDRGETFEKLGAVTDTDGLSDAPDIAFDNRGTLHQVHGEEPESLLRRDHIRYARWEAGTTGFSDATELVEVPDGFHRAGFPAIRIDDDDGVWILADLFARGDRRASALALTHSRDGGKTFGALELVPGSPAPEGGNLGSRQGRLLERFAVTDPDHLVITLSTFLEGESSHVYLLRRDPE